MANRTTVSSCGSILGRGLWLRSLLCQEYIVATHELPLLDPLRRPADTSITLALSVMESAGEYWTPLEPQSTARMNVVVC